MKKDPAKIPIPATAKVIWGQFRMRVLPLAIFSGLVAATVFLWDAVNYSSAIPGVAEGVRSMVASPQPGLLTELRVKPYQLVNEGDPVAVIQVVDSRMPLELAQAEIQLARLRREPSLAQQNAMDYQRVRVDLLRFQTELAVAKVNLQFATKEANRNQSLYKDKQIAEYLYDLSVQTRDTLEMEVTEKTKVVAELEQRLAELRSIGDPQVPATNSDLDQLLGRLEANQACAATNWGTVTLVAPVSGMVSPALRHTGEFVQEGEPLLTIQSPWSDRVVAYLRQPYPLDPEVGMPVRVTTRTRQKQKFSVAITHVGAQVEVITNALAFVRQGALVDVGLPIIMELPAQTRIRPGELVDLYIEPATRPEPVAAARDKL